MCVRVCDCVLTTVIATQDLMSRNHSGLAFAFLSAYLEASGDYEGLRVLDYFLVYRTVCKSLCTHARHHYTNTHTDIDTFADGASKDRGNST